MTRVLIVYFLALAITMALILIGAIVQGVRECPDTCNAGNLNLDQDEHAEEAIG